MIHPFAPTPEKTWPAEHFIAVAEHLRDKAGLEPVFLAGPADDPAAFERIPVYQNAPLAQVKSLMAGAQLFVGNDSGPAHIAAAFGVPVVVLFGPSDPVNWAPWRTEGHVLTNPEAIDGIRCRGSDRGGGCIEGTRVSELGRLLRYSRPYTGHLLLSVVLMALVGAAQAMSRSADRRRSSTAF